MNRFRTYLQGLMASRERIMLAGVISLTVLSMLAGLGQRVLEGYESLASADRLAAISMLLSGPPKHPVPATFIDVDDKSREAWKAESDTPHAALAELVKLAAVSEGTAQARAIVLDFDLSRASDQPADAALHEALRSYPANAPPLLLVRRIKVTGEGGQEVASAASTPYDDALAGKANVYWISSLNDIGADRSVRRIRLWQAVCGETPVVYPSAALVVAAQEMKHGDARLDGFLEQQIKKECLGVKPGPKIWPQLGERTVPLPYLFADVRGPSALRIETAEGETVALRRISARILTGLDGQAFTAPPDVDREAFSNRVVVIGASFTDSGDIHRTPLGSMPGAMIIANSVVQANTIVSGQTGPPWLHNIIAALLFLALVWVVRTFFGAAAVLLSALVTLDVLWVVSHLLGFAAAMEVVVIALSALALYKLIDSTLTIVRKIPGQGWRAVLKH